MNPEAIFDEYQQQENGIYTRRGLLKGAAMGAGVAAMITPSSGSSAISALMCPPEAGSFGGSSAEAGPSGGGDMVGGDEDYSAEVPDDGPGERRLKMTNGRTGETYDRAFVQDGQYVQGALEEFNNFCRDWRQNEIKTMDPKLIDIIWKVWRMLGTDTPFNLTSGYRSPVTNASLNGAAKQSYHMRGKAADLTNPSVRPSQVHKAARTLYAGGVGKYSNFTHVDSGPKRSWGS